MEKKRLLGLRVARGAAEASHGTVVREGRELPPERGVPRAAAARVAAPPRVARAGRVGRRRVRRVQAHVPRRDALRLLSLYRVVFLYPVPSHS